MLVAYVVALGVGGTLVLASLLFGGKDHDSDGGGAGHDAGGHGHDTDGHAHDADKAMILAGSTAIEKHGAIGDAALSLLPVTSIRFWTFFLAFFGLTGLTLTAAALGPGLVVNALLSTGVGYLSGMSVVTMGR